jgi:predicted lipoprotein
LTKSQHNSLVLSLEAQRLSLSQQLTIFQATPTEANLESLRASFLSTWTAWHQLDAFQLDWVRKDFLDWKIFHIQAPLDSAYLDQLISNGNIQQSQIEFKNARGFSSLDYLLHALDTQTLAAYTAVSTASSRLSLLNLLGEQLSNDLSTYVQEWGTVDNNVQATILSNAISTRYSISGSSDVLDQWVNRCRSTLQEITLYRLGGWLGQSVEQLDTSKSHSRYSKSSSALLQASLKSIEDMWNGNNGRYGIRYLLQLKNALSVITAVEQDFVLLHTMIDISIDLESVAAQNWSQIDAIRDQFAITLTHFELQVGPALGTQISFGAGDGD